MNIPKISIIVPVYNVEKYVHRCIDSILAQSFTGFEVLLIDDGSLDKSGEICDEYAMKDSRVRVFHKENGGVSCARNVGIKHATGKFIIFVDSDDYVETNYIENLLHDWHKLPNNNGIVIQSYYKGHGEHWRTKQVADFLASSKFELSKAVENGLLRYSEPHSKMFCLRTILDNDIMFPSNIKNGEDGIFIARYLNHVDCALLSSRAGYHYVEMPNSASHKLYNKEHELESFTIWKNELVKLFKIIGCEKYEFMWELISVPLYRYIRVILQDKSLSYAKKNYLLKRIDESFTSNYGRGRSYSIGGLLFKYLVNRRIFFVLTFLYKFKG